MQIAVKTVAQAATAGVEKSPLKANRATTASARTAQKTSVEPIRRATAWVTGVILAAAPRNRLSTKGICG